jgi:hypothetical protein
MPFGWLHHPIEQRVDAISSRTLFAFDEGSQILEIADELGYMRLHLERIEPRVA